MSARVEFSGIEKRFGDNPPVLSGVDLTIDPGEFLVLLGASGSGKSTLLRILAGLETPTAGSIRIAGKDVTRVEPKARGVAMVFQNYALYPHMTVARNMGFALELQGMSAGERARRVQKAAELLQMTHLLERRPRELSGGQRQRVAIGRAVVREPSIFLFDEPLSNLDAALRGQTRLELKRLQAELKTTTVYVTHDQVEAMSLATRICLLNGGRIEQIGPPSEIFSTPKTRFVAGFIGQPTMNFLPALVENGEVRVDSNLWPLSASCPPGECTLGLRPQELGLSPEPLSGPLVAIDLIEELGSSRIAHGRVGRHAVTLELFQPVPTAGPVYLDLKRATGHFFDSKGNRR